MAEAPKIQQALLDPAWSWGIIAIGDTKHIYLTLHHPTLGQIASLIPSATARLMSDGLATLAGAESAVRQ